VTLQERAAYLVSKPLFWVVFFALSFGFQITRTILGPKLPPLPKALGAASLFRLTDQRGRPFGTPELTGVVWVGSVFCSRCPEVDPGLPSKLREIQHRSRNLGSKFHLVSFASDPETDTPDTLADFALEQKASAKRWVFLSGERPALKKVVDSLYAADPLQPVDTSTRVEAIAPGVNHRLVLVDQATQIRGYYDARKPEDLDAMLRDAALLMNMRFRAAPAPEGPPEDR
jgi:protein SCO1/2